MKTKVRSHARTYPWIWLILCVILSSLVSMLFLPQQSLWTDEITQLTGLALPLSDLFPWLLHRTSDFGVPFDRMPPLSYLIGDIWGWVVGTSPFCYRCLGVVCVALATAVLYHTAYRNFGIAAAVFAGLCFALSPNIAVYAVEIRAYPLFLLLSSIGFYYLLEYESRRSRSLTLLLLTCVMMSYTHYFGVIFSFSVFGWLLLSRWFGGREIASIMRAAIILAACFLGLIPFLIAAEQLSDATIGGDSLAISTLRLGYHLVAHASIALNPIVLGVLFLSLTGLLIGAFRIQKRRVPFFALLGVLIVSFLALVILQWISTGFQALAPSYNLWMIPLAILLLSAGISAEATRVVWVCALAMIFAQGYGAFQLVKYGSYFSHGPYESFAAIIAEGNPSHTAVVYEEGSDQAGMTYFALQYLFQGKVDQFRLVDGSKLMPFLENSEKRGVDRSYLEHYQRLFIVKATSQRYDALLKQMREGITPLPMGTFTYATELLPPWSVKEKQTLMAWTALEIVELDNKKFNDLH